MAHDTLAPWAESVPDAPLLMTATQLAEMPDDARGYELVDGRLVKMPPAGGWHGTMGMGLGAALGVFVDEHDLGAVLAAETGFLVSQPGAPDTVLAPDVAFVRAERVPAPGSPEYEGFWPLAPDLVVEIASPSQYVPELAAKAKRWLDAGVRLVWIVWPKARRVDVWLPGGEAPAESLGFADALTGREVVPGFSYPLARLFR